MPGTRTAPVLTGTAPFTLTSFHWIAASNERKSNMFPFAGAATTAQLEAVAGVLQAGSNASLWRVDITKSFVGAALISNALNELYASLEDNILITYKNATTRASERLYLPAPLDTFLLAGTESIDTSASVFTNILAAMSPALASGFNPTTTRFTEHREMNETQPIG